MKSRKFFTLLALMVGFMTLASCKGQAKNNEAASNTETTGKETAAPVHLNKADFLKKVYNYEASPNEWKYLGNKPAIIDFYADWCGPCKMLAPTVEKMAELHPEVHFYEVDIDEDMDLATRFKVMSVPTLLYFRRGVIANKTIGVISASEMEQAIAEAK